MSRDQDKLQQEHRKLQRKLDAYREEARFAEIVEAGIDSALVQEVLLPLLEAGEQTFLSEVWAMPPAQFAERRAAALALRHVRARLETLSTSKEANLKECKRLADIIEKARSERRIVET
jgi:hypothetical protein